jgi:cathepsin B
MKMIVIALLGLTAVLAMHPVNHDIINHVKKHATTWTPYEHNENPFKDWTEDEIKNMLGLKIDHTKLQSEIVPKFHEDSWDVGHFDGREQWPSCIHAIRNQGKCGSCWAFASTEALSDRFCIRGQDVVLSPQDLLECDDVDYACDGGYNDHAFHFFETVGVVEDKCNPYVAGDKGELNHCLHGKCNGNGKEDYKKFKCVEGSVIHPTTHEDIMMDLHDYGPVEAGFYVYDDFLNYKGGIYKHTYGNYAGGHSVKIVGWGYDKESNTAYWIIANSWGPEWGESGFFRIAFDECQIEKQIYTCKPDTSNHTH